MRTQGIFFITLILLVSARVAIAQEADTDIKLISIHDMKNVMEKSDDILLLDVRTPEEYAAGHLYGAENVDFLSDDFQQVVDDLPRDETVYLYCRSGNRSAKAANLLRSMGFEMIYDMEGGYDAWKKNE